MPRRRNPRTVILEHLRAVNRIMRYLTGRWGQRATIYDPDGRSPWRKRRPEERIENQAAEMVAVITLAQERYRELKEQQP